MPATGTPPALPLPATLTDQPITPTAPMPGTLGTPFAASLLIEMFPSRRPMVRPVPPVPFHSHMPRPNPTSSDASDYYAVLGVARSASSAEIQKAYRALARQYHPDVNKDKSAEARFKAVSAAYEVLKDDRTRALYDRFGSAWQQAEAFQKAGGDVNDFAASTPFGYAAGPRSRARKGPAGPGPFGFDPSSGVDFSEMFESIFGSAGPAQGFRTQAAEPTTSPSHDIESTIEISIAEACAGCSRSLSVNDPDGTSRTIDVKIPAGVADNAELRLRGQGSPRRLRAHHPASAPNQPTRGDIRLTIRVKSDDRFSLSGRDIIARLDLWPWDAALGTRLDLAAPTGTVTLSIPEGSTTGQRLRIRGRGLPVRAGTTGDPGDLLVELRILGPRTLTPAQREAFERLREASTDTPPSR